MPTCPECGVGIQPTWDWCQGCGFDPEGLKPAGWQPNAAAVPAPGPGSPGATPVFSAPSRPAAPFVPPPGQLPPPGYPAPPGFVPPPKSGPSTGRVLVIIGAVVAVLLLLPVLAIAAVTLLGRSATSKFEPVAPAINRPVSTTAAPVTWTPWVAPDKKYQIDFPCVPETTINPTSGDIKGAATTSCGLTTADVTYFAQTVDIVDGTYVADPNLFLDTMVSTLAEEIGRSTGGTVAVRAVDKTDFAGMPSRRYTLDGTFKGRNGLSETATIDGRLIVSGNRAYLLFASTGNGATADLERFISSFHIL